MVTYRTFALALALCASAAQAQTLANTTNFNRNTPAAPLGSTNVVWQNDGGHPTVNISAYALYPTVQVACPTTGDLAGPVYNAFAALSTAGGGIIDARRCSAATGWTTAFSLTQANTLLLLPCAALSMSQPLTVAAGVRNTRVQGCAYQGGSAASGTAGGTVLNWTGTGSAIVVGDASHASNTSGFALSDLALVTAAAGGSATALTFHRTQEIDVERVYLIGNGSTGQTGMILDGVGNYTGGSFLSLHFASFGTAVSMTGDSSGAANASTFLRLHVDCPTSGGNPIAGTVAVSLAYGDGNTFTGGDWESCDTMLSLGAGATNNSFFGVRNENSNTQVSAAAGSSYNLWETAGTMFTGQLVDNGTHNTFWDSFHRGVNNLNGDLWRSQADTTVTNHFYTGIGLGNVRGLQDEYITDQPSGPGLYQPAWLWGPADPAGGNQIWQLEDLIAGVNRIGVNQTVTGGGNDQTFLNATGSAAVCVNCSTNSGTGGFNVASGGSSATSVWKSDGSGNTTQTGYLRFSPSGTEAWRFNCASSSACNIDSMTSGSAVHHLRLYNGAGTDISGEGTSPVTVNNTSGSTTGGFIVYLGGSASNTKAFYVGNSSGSPIYQLPGVKSSSGYTCIHADNSGYLYATGADCGTGSGSGSVTSVGLSAPTQFAVTNSPVSTSGTLTFAWNNQTANYVLAGPSTGSPAAPTFRALVAADVPTLNQNTSGTAANVTGVVAAANGGTGANNSAATGVAQWSSGSYSASTALASGTTATTQAVGDNSTNVETTAGAEARMSAVPAWLRYLGTGADGANTNASGTLAGEKYYTNFTVPYGNTVTVGAVGGASGLVIHATGTCTIAGSITATGGGATGNAWMGGPGGGGGGGTGAGSAGGCLYSNPMGCSSATAGAASGGAGGTLTTVPNSTTERAALDGGFGFDLLNTAGSVGGAGNGNTGSGGAPAANVILICGAITGTDGTHTGTISANGSNGVASTGNNIGGGGGGGGGVIVLSSRAAVATWPTLSTTGGTGGGCGSYTGCGAGGNGTAGWSATFGPW